MSPYASYLVETSLTLVGVCALAVVVLWGARRLGPSRADGPISLCGHLQLEPRRAVYLVRVGEQVFIIGVGEAGFTKLGEIAFDALRDDASGESRRAPGLSRFSALLSREPKPRKADDPGPERGGA